MALTVFCPTFAGGKVPTSISGIRVNVSGTGGGTATLSATITVRKAANGATVATLTDSAPVSSFTSMSLTDFGTLNLSSGVGYTFEIDAHLEASGGSDLDDGSTSGSMTAWGTVTPSAAVVSPVGSVISLTPLISLNYSSTGSPSGPYAFGSYQVQIRDKATAGATLSYDSGEVATTSSQKSAKHAEYTYAGPTLTAGVTYQVQAWVWDSWQHQKSGGSGWIDFVAGAAPALPTALLPSGLQTTITPTIGGTFHVGTGGNMAAWQYRIKQNGVQIYTSGDITLSKTDGQSFSQVYGTANPSDTPSTPPTLPWGADFVPGIRTKNTDGVYSEWAEGSFSTKSAPTTPTGLAPNGAVISDTTPTFQGVHNDPEGASLTNLEIWLWTTADGTPVSGWNPKVIAVADLDSYDNTTKVWKYTSPTTLTDSPPTGYSWQAATEGDSGPGYGPRSDIASFTVAQAPSVSVTSPTDGSDVTGVPVSVVYSVTPVSGTTLASTRRKLFADDGTTLLYDSGADTDGAGNSGETDFTKDLGFSGFLNGVTYKLQVSAIDSLGVEATSDLISITVSWTPPATITGLTATAIAGGGSTLLPGIALNWMASAEATFDRYRIYRRPVGTTDWFLLAEITSIDTVDYADYLCSSGVLYGYTVTPVILTNGQQVEGDKPTPAQASVDFANLAFLHDVGAPGHFVALLLDSETAAEDNGMSVQQPFGSTAPVAYFNESNARTLSLTGSISNSDDTDRAVYSQLVAVVARQQTNTAMLCYRNDLGSVMFCSASKPQRRGQSGQSQWSVTLQEVDYPAGDGLSAV